MPWYGREFYADENVLVMTLEQEAAYMRLLWNCWQEGSIPDDPPKLAAICKNMAVKKFERTIWQALAGCFTKASDGRLVNPKVEALRAAKNQRKTEWSEAGKRGAEKRWGPKCDDGVDIGYPIDTLQNPDGVGVSVDCRLPNVEYRMQIGDCRMPSKDTHKSVCVTDLSPNGPPSERFEEAWEKWPLKVEKDAAAREWISVVTRANEEKVFACLDRFLKSRQAANGAVTKFAKWLDQAHRDRWESEWPEPAGSSRWSERVFQ